MKLLISAILLLASTAFGSQNDQFYFEYQQAPGEALSLAAICTEKAGCLVAQFDDTKLDRHFKVDDNGNVWFKTDKAVYQFAKVTKTKVKYVSPDGWTYGAMTVEGLMPLEIQSSWSHAPWFLGLERRTSIPYRRVRMVRQIIIHFNVAHEIRFTAEFRGTEVHRRADVKKYRSKLPVRLDVVSLR